MATQFVQIPAEPSVMIPTLRSLRPGESVVYHTGYLFHDRWQNSVSDVASEAWRLHELGKIKLYQRRLGPPVRDGKIDRVAGMCAGFEYIAVGKPRH